MDIGSLVLWKKTGCFGIILSLCQEAWGKKRWCISWGDGRVAFEWENYLELLDKKNENQYT